MKAALRSLLSKVIDYAGLFPPATLDLKTSLANYAEYLRSDEAWMLSTFVLPISEFDAAAAYLGSFSQEKPLTISALGPKTADEGAFLAAVKAAVQAVRAFNSVETQRAVVQQFEMPLPPQFDVASFAEMRTLFAESDLRVFWEVPADAAESTMALLAKNNTAANTQPFGFKLRTGGVTADAFPTSAQIARALAAAGANKVPIKFTAGLHHPLRMFRDEVDTKMHGFLNVIGAGVLMLEHNWDEAQITAMLDDEDAGSFSFNDAVFRWRDFEVNAARIAEHRQLITSFGSCSFDEPREDLRAFGLF